MGRALCNLNDYICIWANKAQHITFLKGECHVRCVSTRQLRCLRQHRIPVAFALWLVALVRTGRFDPVCSLYDSTYIAEGAITHIHAFLNKIIMCTPHMHAPKLSYHAYKPLRTLISSRRPCRSAPLRRARYTDTLTSPINETASKKVIPANVRVITLDDKGGYSCVNRRVNTRILT